MEPNEFLNVIDIAIKTRVLRKKNVSDTVTAVSKTYDLTDEEKTTLHKCLIEDALGINSPSYQDRPSIQKALRLYKAAVQGRSDLGIEGERCNPTLAEDVLFAYIVNSAK